MSTSALRAVMISAAVVLGVLVVWRGFPIATGVPFPTPTPRISTGPQGPTIPSPGTSPQINGVTVQIVNSTSVTNLAARTKRQLKQIGYRVVKIANALGSYERTTIFFRVDARADAEYLADGFFAAVKPRVEPATNNLEPDIQITVALGDDYGALVGGQKG